MTDKLVTLSIRISHDDLQKLDDLSNMVPLKTRTALARELLVFGMNQIEKLISPKKSVEENLKALQQIQSTANLPPPIEEKPLRVKTNIRSGQLYLI